MLIHGVGRYDLNRGATSLEPRLIDFYRPAQQKCAAQVFDMAGVGPKDIDALQIYDSFSCHIPLALEGYGYCASGEAGRFMREHGISLRGKLPVNTSGGHLSESYMQGWNHQVEAVRQVRGECGERQVPDCRLRPLQFRRRRQGRVHHLRASRRTRDGLPGARSSSLYDQPMWASVDAKRMELQQCCAPASASAIRRRRPARIASRWTTRGSRCPGRGKILSWVVFHRQYFDDYPPPYNVIAVQLAEGPIVMSNLSGPEPTGTWIDKPVEMIYEKGADGETLPRFRLSKE